MAAPFATSVVYEGETTRTSVVVLFACAAATAVGALSYFGVARAFSLAPYRAACRDVSVATQLEIAGFAQ